MKKNIFILCIFSFMCAKAQKMPADYFQEADNFFDNKEYEKALSAYQYIVDNYQKNELYPRAFYNTGYIYLLQKDFEKAMPVFKTILNSNFNETENAGGGIMQDPYTNYRHRASEMLSGIFYEKNMYDSALYYFSLSDSTYPYLHFCGNELAENKIYYALRYADNFQKLNQEDKAVHALLPAIFITIENNDEIIDALKKLFKNKKNVKKEFDESLATVYSKRNKKTNVTLFFIRFLNTEIAVPDGFETGKKKFDKMESLNKIRQSNFYKMITEIPAT